MMCSKHRGNDERQSVGTKAHIFVSSEAMEDRYSCAVCQPFVAVG
jgi:hypothetical protein